VVNWARERLLATVIGMWIPTSTLGASLLYRSSQFSHSVDQLSASDILIPTWKRVSEVGEDQ
jgi:hypothetical protein